MARETINTITFNKLPQLLTAYRVVGNEVGLDHPLVVDMGNVACDAIRFEQPPQPFLVTGTELQLIMQALINRAEIPDGSWDQAQSANIVKNIRFNNITA